MKAKKVKKTPKMTVPQYRPMNPNEYVDINHPDATEDQIVESILCAEAGGGEPCAFAMPVATSPNARIDPDVSGEYSVDIFAANSRGVAVWAVSGCDPLFHSYRAATKAALAACRQMCREEGQLKGIRYSVELFEAAP